MKVAAVWFRNDLRLHDNGSINQAVRLVKNKIVSHVLPVYCYDPRYFGDHARSRQTGLPKTGMHRQHFVAESLRDLRKSLRVIGSDLLVCEGRPEDVFTRLLPRGSTIFTQQEVTQEELEIDSLVKNAGFNLQTVWGMTLYDLRDFTGRRGADFSSCTNLINETKKLRIKPRECLPTPKHGDLPFPVTVGDGNAGKSGIAERLRLYSTARLQEPWLYTGATSERSVYDDKYSYKVDPRGVMGDTGGIRGGESAGLKRVDHYLVPRLVDKYKDTRNGMLGADYSSKFSAWLAHGCVSPRFIYHRIKEHERRGGGPNRGTGHLIFELCWRDFFIFYCRSHNPKIFCLHGVRPRSDVRWVEGDRAKHLFQKWVKGETGYPLVDANMRELASTGFMSNRGRQNVASFLAYNLRVDWRWGAEYFETMLVDHHVCANWGNWHSAAGLTGKKAVFNITWQATKYDRKGRYVRHWIPALRDVPDSLVHEPWKWGGRHEFEGYVATTVVDAGGRGDTNRGRAQHRGRDDANRGPAHGHGKNNKKKDKKRPKKKGIKKYFKSKFGLDEDEERDLDRGVHGDYVTGQIGAATRMKARKMKSRQLKVSDAAMPPPDAASSHAPVHQTKRSRKQLNNVPADVTAASNASNL